MKLKQGTLQHLQEYVDFKIKERGFEDESIQTRLLLLAEEVGELVRACRKINSIQTEEHKDYHTPQGEIADVINLVMAVAIELRIDVEKAYREKEAKNDKRVWN